MSTETRPSTLKSRWRTSCFTGSGVVGDCRSAQESHLEKLMRRQRWKRHTLEQDEADKGNQSDAEVLGVGHRPGCAVPDTCCAKTLVGQSALKRHVEVSGKEPRLLSNVRPVKCRGLDDSTQHSQGGSGTGMRFGREDNSLCGTRGSWEFGAVAEPFRHESPRSHNRSDKRPAAPGDLDTTRWIF